MPLRSRSATVIPDRTMLHLSQLDLATDPAARRVVKDEAVSVEFAAAAGELMSLEGPNRYARGDAIVGGASGERWVVSRERFDAKYVPEGGIAHGEAGTYRNLPSVVLAKEMNEPFSIARSAAGDILTGDAGDWVMQYAPGDYGVVKAARFAKVYRDA
jgi:PGDYG protein